MAGRHLLVRFQKFPGNPWASRLLKIDYKTDVVWNFSNILRILLLFHDRGRYHIEATPLICRANQLTGFYMITTSIIKELKNVSENFLYQAPVRCTGVFSYRTTGLATQTLAKKIFLSKLNTF